MFVFVGGIFDGVGGYRAVDCKVSRREWQRGEAKCTNCGMPVDQRDVESRLFGFDDEAGYGVVKVALAHSRCKSGTFILELTGPVEW